jgi:hypothetical protein
LNYQLTILLFLCVVCSHLFAQRTMEGAYQGELIAPKSVLIISSQKDSILQGKVYSSQSEYFTFYGIISGDKIRGSILVPPDAGDVIIFHAQSRRDTIKATLISSIDSVAFVESALVKVSKSPKYNLAKTFGKIEPQFDSLLVGEWESLYTLNHAGDTLDSPFDFVMQYFANGTWNFRSPMIDKLKAPMKRQIQVRYTWSTNGRKLITKTQRHIPSEIKFKIAQYGVPTPPEYTEHTEDYQIKGDTLITTSMKTKSYYIKK